MFSKDDALFYGHIFVCGPRKQCVSNTVTDLTLTPSLRLRFYSQPR